LLVPSEQQGMVADLREAKVELKCLKYNKEKIQPVSQALQALLSKDAEVKTLAQKSLVSYLRSVFLQPKKHVFDVQALPATEFALSLGLTSVPKLKMLKGGAGGGGGGKPKGARADGEDGEADVGNESPSPPSRSPSPSPSPSPSRDDDESDENGDFLVLKTKHEPATRRAADVDGDAETLLPTSIASNKKKKKMKIKVNKSTGTKVIFDDEGRAMDPLEALAGDVGDGEGHREFASIEERAAAAQKRLRERDAKDKRDLKELKKAKRQEKRARRIEREHGTGGAVAYVGVGSESESESNDSGDGRHGGRPSSSSDDDRVVDDFAFRGMRQTSEATSKQSLERLEDQEAAALALIRGS